MEGRESRHFRKGERAYNLTDDQLPIYIGEGLGNLDYEDAIELSMIRRTTLGLPATKEFISIFAPPPEKTARGWKASHTSRASKNNPYVCVHCDYRSTRYGNMVTHLRNSHSDYTTDPRDNRQ